MPAPLPDSVRTRACELGRTLGLDAVVEALRAEGHKVARATVGGWLKEGRRSAQSARQDAFTFPESSKKVFEDAPGADLEILNQLDQSLSTMLEAARKNEDARLFATLIGRRVELRKAMQAFRPPPKVDPDLDPTALEARAAVRRRITKMIENAELARGEESE